MAWRHRHLLVRYGFELDPYGTECPGLGTSLWSAEANISFSLAVNAASANFIFYRQPNQPGGKSGGGSIAAATTRSFSARDHRRRRCTDVITST
jgi:hypothetical protein